MKKVFLAVDKGNLAEAAAIIEPLKNHLAGIKLGLQFFYANGVDGVKKIKQQFSALPIFLDIKLHDVPNTVAGALSSILDAGLEPDYITLHTTGGAAMMQRAVEVIKKRNKHSKLLGVTLLTSLDKFDLAGMGIEDMAQDEIVCRLAKNAADCGMAGIICSPLEIKNIRAANIGGDGFVIITPGISLDGNKRDDQKRVATPEQAIADGANFIVMGRGILQAPDPVAELQKINQFPNMTKE